MPDGGNRKGKKPEGAVDIGPLRQKRGEFDRCQVIGVQEVHVGEHVVTMAAEEGAVFPDDGGVVATGQRARYGNRRVGHIGQKGPGPHDGVHVHPGIVIHEKTMGVAARTGLGQAARKTAGAAQIGIAHQRHVRKGRQGQAAVVVDDQEVHLFRQRVALQEGVQPKRGGCGGLCPAKGGHADQKPWLAAWRLWRDPVHCHDLPGGDGAQGDVQHAVIAPGNPIRQVDQVRLAFCQGHIAGQHAAQAGLLGHHM